MFSNSYLSSLDIHRKSSQTVSAFEGKNVKWLLKTHQLVRRRYHFICTFICRTYDVGLVKAQVRIDNSRRAEDRTKQNTGNKSKQSLKLDVLKNNFGGFR